MRKKAVQFMKEKGWLEVMEKDTLWTNGAILVLHNPEDLSIGKDEYGCNKYLKPGKYKYECKMFLPVTKEDNFPDIDGRVKKFKKEENYHKVQVKEEFGCLKLLKLSSQEEQFVVEFVNDDKSVFINYEYYRYLMDEKHIWTASEWKIKTKDDPVLAYCENALLALVMPINLGIENNSKGENHVR